MSNRIHLEETIVICADCREPIEVARAGDEAWNVCTGCRQVEGETVEISEDDWFKEKE